MKKLFLLTACLLALTATAQVKNLAKNCAAYHSSCANYDNTAHLATDGDFAVLENPFILAQYEDSPSGEDKTKVFDGTTDSKFLTFHAACWLQYAFSAGNAYVANKYTISSANDEPRRDPKNWQLQASNNGTDWVTLDAQSNIDFADRQETKTFTFENDTPYKTYRLNVTANHGDNKLQFSEFALYNNETNLKEEWRYSSAWISKNYGNQWIYIDLGATATIDGIKLHWGEGFAKAYSIDISDNAENWRQIYQTAEENGGIDEIIIPSTTGRYIRLSAVEFSGWAAGYELAEFEIFGTGGKTVEPKPQPNISPDGKLLLTGGNWKVQRTNFVTANGEQLSQAGYDDENWIVATVPGTVLTSYLNNGAVPDPNYGDQQLQISDAFFVADFWYRNSFKIPETYTGKNIFLNFDGINWKADIYVNGNYLGRIDGAFIRGKFDITEYVSAGDTAYLAVFIHRNDTPGAVTLQSRATAGYNGGALGADNPTIHASVGWDWLPTIRGRNIGIQDEVFLSAAGAVSIENPFVKTELFDNWTAKLTLLVDVKNNTNAAVSGILKGNVAGVEINQTVNLSANETKSVTVSNLSVENPQLWYPNGYGEQFLYDLNVSFEINEDISDTKTTKFGIREITTTTTGGTLTVFVNGKRIFLRGGNWGLSESMLRFGEKDYDNCVKLHKDMNFTMIRNWVGMTGSDYFYQACDRYGILIWDDFWLANPGDGPNPNDEAMFMANANDKIRRVRNHPSVALYCGRNEGDPPATLNAALQNAISTLDGTRLYIPHSAANSVSGFGPYGVQNPKWYFSAVNNRKIHSERGLPNVPVLETMQAMMPANKLFPINDMWGIHDFSQEPAAKANDYVAAVNKYGTATSIEDFCQKAQMVNMENHKAMFEGFAGYKANGLLMWMSHPAWQSMVWQTYDYYLDQNGGYYGCRRACEPLHILWDANANRVKVANNTGKTVENITAKAYVYNMSGVLQYSDSLLITSLADDVRNCFALTYPTTISPVHFIKLKLMKGDELLSDNFYWRATDYQNYTPLQTMNKVTLIGKVEKSSGKITAQIKNPSNDVALMIRLKVQDEQGERILPVFYSDNYFSLLPGETKKITMAFESDKTPKLAVEGWNIFGLEEKDDLSSIKTTKQTASDILLYPNPNDGLLYISGIADFDVQIFNLSGEKVLQKQQQNGKIDISKLTNGVYVVKLISGNETFERTILKS
ncbi:MAG: discoidin domain-containing protein [Prevotellaceae bacterium]|nr:discoidin domain-containing protein [Prevotellaceae bacterium]